MCLTIDKEKTKKMSKKTGEVTIWKVYLVIGKNVFPPVQSYAKNIHQGMIISDRVNKGIKKDYHDYLFGSIGIVEIARGIHVMLTREKARQYKKELGEINSGEKYVIMRCRAKMSDFVATGTTCYSANNWIHKSAVFMKIHVSKTDWKKSLNGDFR